MIERIEQLTKKTAANIILELHMEPQKVYNNCRIFESGSINIEHIEHFHQADGLKPSPQLPEALSTTQAQELLRKAQSAGLLDEAYQYVGHKSRAAILAEEMGTKLGLNPLWKPFEELWDVTNLRQTCYNAGGTEKGGRVKGHRDKYRDPHITT